MENGPASDPRLQPARGRLLYWLRGELGAPVVLAIAVGIGAGLGAIVFRNLIAWFTIAFTGVADYGAAGHQANRFVPGLGRWFVVLAPVVGGLLYGPLVDKFAREARGHGVPEVMLAVARHGGRIRARVALVKALASAVCIGSGGSVGREGPIVQIGSALGSTFGQIARLPEPSLRLLVSCGAAGGISATFNAPIAGAMFALELILRDFEARSFGLVVLSSVAANVVGRSVFGGNAFLPLPPFALVSRWEYLPYAGLGVTAGLAGVTFTRLLYGTEDLFDRVWRGPEWLRPAVGAVMLGALLLVLPQMYGVGYAVIESAIGGGYVVPMLIVLTVGKMVATSVTIAMGGSGGVFAPSLFIGAMLGSAYGQVMGAAFPHVVGSAGAYGLVGMGAVFASAARAPITAVLIIFELTGEYRIILPLLFATVLATGVANLLTRDTIYTLKLLRHGVDLWGRKSLTLMDSLVVADAMQPAPAPWSEDLPLATAVERFAGNHRDRVPVVDGTGAYRGTISPRELEGAVGIRPGATPIRELAREVTTLIPSQRLSDALGTLVAEEDGGLPVVDRDQRALVGWITHRDVLRAYQARLAQSASAGPPASPAHHRL